MKRLSKSKSYSKNNNGIDVRKYRYMLENAGRIQHIKNVLQGCEEWDGEYELVSDKRRYGTFGFFYRIPGENNGEWQLLELSDWEFKFLIKNRKFKSGLATPMARYYGWKAINK